MDRLEVFGAYPNFSPFGRKLVLHVHDVSCIGQNHGKPVLAVIIPMFKMLDYYERSELQSAIVMQGWLHLSKVRWIMKN